MDRQVWQHLDGLATSDVVLLKLHVVRKGAAAALTGVERTVGRAACTFVILRLSIELSLVSVFGPSFSQILYFINLQSWLK
jgi:hypothetical protein